MIQIQYIETIDDLKQAIAIKQDKRDEIVERVGNFWVDRMGHVPSFLKDNSTSFVLSRQIASAKNETIFFDVLGYLADVKRVLTTYHLDSFVSFNKEKMGYIKIPEVDYSNHLFQKQYLRMIKDVKNIERMSFNEIFLENNLSLIDYHNKRLEMIQPGFSTVDLSSEIYDLGLAGQSQASHYYASYFALCAGANVLFEDFEGKKDVDIRFREMIAIPAYEDVKRLLDGLCSVSFFRMPDNLNGIYYLDYPKNQKSVEYVKSSYTNHLNFKKGLENKIEKISA